jgi:hypothetical protein
VVAFLDLLKERGPSGRTDVVGANRFPVCLRKMVKGQAGVAISAEAGHGGGVMLFVFGTKGGDGTLRLLREQPRRTE